MNYQPSGPSPVAPPPPLRSSLRTLPSLRRSLRSLSRGRNTAEKGGCRRCDAQHDDGSDHQQQGPSAPEGTASDNEGMGNKHRSDEPNHRTNPAGNLARRQEKETDRAKSSPKGQKGRGRSRSRVRALLMRRGSNDGTATPSETPDTSLSPNATEDKDRGRSKSRLRRLFMGRDRSESRKRNGDRDGRATTTMMNTADPLGPQGCRNRECERSAVPAAAVIGTDARAAPHEFARFRSAVVEELPSDSGRGVNRNESGQLSELSTLQQPPTDLLPIQSGILAVTAASRRLMRSVSNLGMEDPVVREVGPVDVDLAVADDAGEDGEVVSTADDQTATSEDGGGFDRRMFDQLLLLEANVKDRVRAVHETSPDDNLERQSDVAIGGPRRSHFDLTKQSAVLDTSNQPMAAGPHVADEPTADSTARESVPTTTHKQLPKLDESRSALAFQSILDRESPSTTRAPSSSSTKQPLSQTEVDTVLAALAHSRKKQLKSGRNRRQSLDMADLGSDRPRVGTEWEEGHRGMLRPGEHPTTALGDPLLTATSTHSLLSVDGAGRNRVVVKVRVKRRSTLHCGPGSELRSHHHQHASSRIGAQQKVYQVPPVAALPSSSFQGDAATKTGADDPSAAASSSATVQELMSRPRLLPDMDSVFA